MSWITEEELRELYHEQGLNQAEIAKRFGKSRSAVSYKMKSLGISTRNQKKKPPVSKERLHELYWVEEKTLAEVAEMLDTHSSNVRKWMIRYNIQRRTQGGKGEHIPPDTLRELYREHRNVHKVAKALGRNIYRVINDMDMYGINRASLTDSIKEYQFKPKMMWVPCCDCGDPMGKANGTSVTPSRYDGTQFGFRGKLCFSCYQKHYHARRSS